MAFIDGEISIRDPALVDFFGFGNSTASGEPVSEGMAESYTAYFSALHLLSSTISSLPLQLCWDDKEGTNVNEYDNPFLCPNPRMTRSEYWYYCVWQILGWGNSYTLIIRDDADNIIALWPLPASQVIPKKDNDGNVKYTFKAMNKGEKTATYNSDEVMHITGMGFDGLVGKSIAKMAREAIGLGLGTEKFGANFFGNNAVPGGIVTHPTELNLDGRQTLEREIEERLKGAKRSRRVIVLDEGMKYNAVGVSPEDGQFLQTRRFQVREICRWFRIPPHMLYDLDEATTGNIEHQSIGFTTYSLMPLLVKIVQAAEKSMIPSRRTYKAYYFRHETSNLLLMDTATRLENYARGRNMGLYTLNDIKRAEKQPLLPPELGDTYLIPSTMKVFRADSREPIDPKVMEVVMQLLYPIPDLNNKQVAAILTAALPTGEDKLIKALTLAYTNKRDADDDIIPLTPATDPKGGDPGKQTEPPVAA